MICVLDVVEGPARGLRFCVADDESVTVGRSAATDVRLDDPHVSRNHLIIEATGSRFRLRDLGSSNGTFLNDARSTCVDLQHGDQIRTGRTVIQVEFCQTEAEVSELEPVVRWNESPPVRVIDSLAGLYDDLTQKISVQETVQRNGNSASQSSDVAKKQPSELPQTFVNTFDGEIDTLFRFNNETALSAADRVFDCLREWTGELSLVVNLGQLDREARSLVQGFAPLNQAKRISEALCILQPVSGSRVLEVYGQCLGKDAAICIGSQDKLDGAQLLDVADSLSFPSLLYQLANDRSSGHRKVAEVVDFLVFESARAGKFCLLANAAHESKLNASS